MQIQALTPIYYLNNNNHSSYLFTLKMRVYYCLKKKHIFLRSYFKAFAF